MAAAAILRAGVQNSTSTNAPACPVCKSTNSNDYGYLVTSESPKLLVPLTATAVRVRLCLGCGAIFGTRDA